MDWSDSCSSLVGIRNRGKGMIKIHAVDNGYAHVLSLWTKRKITNSVSKVG